MFKTLTEKLGRLFGAEAKRPAQHHPVKPAVTDRTDELAPYQQDNGTYIFNLTVAPAEDGALKLYSTDLSGFCSTHHFPADFTADQKMISVEHGLDGARFSLDFNYNLKGHFYVRHPDSDLHIDQNCEISGLKTGDQYQLIFVPEGVDWQPAKQVKEKAPARVCPILRPRF